MSLFCSVFTILEMDHFPFHTDYKTRMINTWQETQPLVEHYQLCILKSLQFRPSTHQALDAADCLLVSDTAVLTNSRSRMKPLTQEDFVCYHKGVEPAVLSCYHILHPLPPCYSKAICRITRLRFQILTLNLSPNVAYINSSSPTFYQYKIEQFSTLCIWKIR